MKLFELFEQGKKKTSPEEIRLKTVLAVLRNRMNQDDFPSKLSWHRIERVLDKSNIPFSQSQVRSFIDDKFPGLSMDDTGTIKVNDEPEVSSPELDMPVDTASDLDLTGSDLGMDTTAPAAADMPTDQEPVTDVNATDQMARRALKRRMG